MFKKNKTQLSKVTPKQMVSIFGSNTIVQAETLLEKYYKGLFIHTYGKIKDISISYSYVTFSFNDKEDVYISANFPKPLGSELSVLKEGERIDLVGRVFNVGKNIVALDDCKLFALYKQNLKGISKENE